MARETRFQGFESLRTFLNVAESTMHLTALAGWLPNLNMNMRGAELRAVGAGGGGGLGPGQALDPLAHMS